MTTTTAPLTADLFDQFRTRNEWEGFGYIGERRWMDDAQRAEADAAALDAANALGWTVADLFAWANSKAGRWFADCRNDRHAARYLPGAVLA